MFSVCGDVWREDRDGQIAVGDRRIALEIRGRYANHVIAWRDQRGVPGLRGGDAIAECVGRYVEKPGDPASVERNAAAWSVDEPRRVLAWDYGTLREA